MGNSLQGFVLPDQVQGVREGAGITIAVDGVISVNSQTVVGLMKMGQTLPTAIAAYNSYQWPLGPGPVGNVVKIDSTSGGVTKLKWDTAAGFTNKGQLLVGTGPGTETLLNVGLDGSILIADSTTVSGLNYTTNYVTTTGAQGAANIPAGITAQRPSSPALGAFRFNDTLDALEFWNGTAWEIVASSATNGFVEKTSDTGSAIIPTGTTGQRDTSPLAGFFRYNATTGNLEYFDGVIWKTVSASATGSFVPQSVPVSGTPSAEIPVGTTAQRQSFPNTGFLRYNSDLQALEVWNGTFWDNTSAEVNSLSFGTTGLIPNTPTIGDIVVSGILNITNGGTNANNAVDALNNLLPVQAGNNGFYFVTNGTIPSWQAPPPMVNTFSAGSTGFNPATATTGIVTLSGTLNLANGGTGATTQAGAANNILPSQGGNVGRFLATDGTNVVWSPMNPMVTSWSGGVTGFTPAVNTTGAVIMAGILNIASGGTGAATRNVALNNLLPAQGGSATYALTTDGTNASWQPAGGGGGGVTQLVAGTNVTLSPAGGTGVVTINASGGGGGGGVTSITAGTNVTVTPVSGVGAVTISATAGAGGVSQLVAGTNITLTPAGGTGTVTIDATGGGGSGGGTYPPTVGTTVSGYVSANAPTSGPVFLGVNPGDIGAVQYGGVIWVDDQSGNGYSMLQVRTSGSAAPGSYQAVGGVIGQATPDTPGRVNIVNDWVRIA